MGRAGNVPIGYWWLQLPATPLLFPADRLHVLLPYLQPLDPLFLFPALASLPKRGRVKDAAKRERLGERSAPPSILYHYVCTIGTTLHHLDILQRSFYQNLWSMHCSFNPVLQKSVFLFLWLFEELNLCINCHRLVYGGEQTDDVPRVRITPSCFRNSERSDTQTPHQFIGCKRYLIHRSQKDGMCWERRIFLLKHFNGSNSQIP